jgi:hypothetical protein
MSTRTLFTATTKAIVEKINNNALINTECNENNKAVNIYGHHKLKAVVKPGSTSKPMVDEDEKIRDFLVTFNMDQGSKNTDKGIIRLPGTEKQILYVKSSTFDSTGPVKGRKIFPDYVKGKIKPFATRYEAFKTDLQIPIILVEFDRVSQYTSFDPSVGQRLIPIIPRSININCTVNGELLQFNCTCSWQVV